MILMLIYTNMNKNCYCQIKLQVEGTNNISKLGEYSGNLNKTGIQIGWSFTKPYDYLKKKIFILFLVFFCFQYALIYDLQICFFKRFALINFV